MTSGEQESPTYSRRQRGGVQAILAACGAGVGLLATSKLGQAPGPAVALLFGLAGLLVLLAFCFAYLHVYDDGERLAARFGPIPVFGVSLRYDEIQAAEPAQSTWIDGWGIHYTIGRGWIYNLWGYGCVRIQLGNRVIRLGTDEPEQLAEWIRRKAGLDDNGAASIRE